MATPVQNPFDTQQPKPQAGIIAGAAAPATSTSLPVQPAYQAEKPVVNKSTETTSGQLDSLLAGDSPVLQRARALAAQQANSRGLLNSSMAAEAGTAAMIDRAVPIANADANVYDTRARSNADAGNQSLSLGANIAAQMGLQRGQQEFQAGESQLDRSQQTNLQTSQHQFQSGESALDRTQQTDLQKGQQQFQAGESQLDRTQQSTLQQMQIDAQRSLQESSQKFTEIQSQLDRTQQIELTKLQAALQDALNTKGLAPQFAASVSANTMAAMQAILSNHELTPEARRGAIDNLLAVANQQLAWGSVFYNTPIPGIGSLGPFGPVEAGQLTEVAPPETSQPPPTSAPSVPTDTAKGRRIPGGK